MMKLLVLKPNENATFYPTLLSILFIDYIILHYVTTKNRQTKVNRSVIQSHVQIST